MIECLPWENHEGFPMAGLKNKKVNRTDFILVVFGCCFLLAV